MSFSKTIFSPSQLQLLSEGDERVFTEFYEHYYSKIRPFVFRFTRSESDTEEIMQETFVRIWLSRDQLPSIENVDGWIYRIASRECLSHLRKTQKDPVVSSLNHNGFDQTVLSSDGTPFEKVGVEQMRIAVEKFIDSMPKQRKRIYKMSREEGLKPAEIAAILSLSVSTIKNTLSTSLRDLRQFLLSMGFENLTMICCFPLFY